MDPVREAVAVPARIVRYFARGRRPWSVGYQEYKELVLRSALRNRRLLASFSEGTRLPRGYGLRLDERIVEYPWLYARLSNGPSRLLDAGSTLNHRFVLSLPRLSERSIVCMTLASERNLRLPHVTYTRADLRRPPFRPETFDEIACISTLEHVGMDNTRLYTTDRSFREHRNDDFLIAVRELKRLLRPGGRLFLTVPFGSYEDHGWLQQFDAARVRQVIEAFGPSAVQTTCFRYDPTGWQVATLEECDDCRYFDVHRGVAAIDGAAAARAVVCLALRA
jgi:SAM-dependent methyltransferase